MGANAAAAGLPTLLAAALLLSSAFFPSASAASSFPASRLLSALLHRSVRLVRLASFMPAPTD